MEWVANVVSALLLAIGLPVIAAVSTRGLMKAAEIAGVDWS